MVRLGLLIPLLLVATGYILDRTDDYKDGVLHVIPPLERAEERSNIRIRYELVDLELSPVNNEYLVNTVIAGAKRQLERLLWVNNVSEKIFFDFEECAEAPISEKIRN